MNNVISTDGAALLEKVVVMGDLSSLSPTERLSYYQKVCESVGLNPLTKPFDYIQLNGKLTLYARKDATDQLRKIHGISINITSREKIGDIYVVTAKARNRDGREDESIGAVSIANLKGDYLANALMKAETKAKRRVTLSIAGLGMLDETELETVPFDTIQYPNEPPVFHKNEQQTEQQVEETKTTETPNNSEPKQVDSKQSEQVSEITEGAQEFTLLNMDVGTSPSGLMFAKIFVQELPAPILAKGDEGVAEANKIDGGQGDKIIIETYEENGFTFLKKVVASRSTAA